MQKQQLLHMKQIAQLLIILLVLCTPLAVSHANNQTDTQQATTVDQQSYRDELDKWMLRAYEGDRDAQFKVGVLFTNDQLAAPDFEQAVYWYKQAARQGHVLAQYNLGHQYLTGAGVEQSNTQAMQWWLQAAKQNHPLAQFNIGRAYYLGIGLAEDHSQSKYWFQRAAANDEPKSIDILNQLGWSTSGATSAIETEQTNSNDSLASKIVPIDEGSNAAQEPSNPEVIQDAQIQDTIGDAASSASSSEPIEEQTDHSDSGVAEPIEPIAETEQVSPTTQTRTEPQQQTLEQHAIALYTNPKVRSVLIAILPQRDTLTEISRDDEWAIVSSTEGFPVWVHGDYLDVIDGVGRLTGQSVNARSVPIVTNGTVVGKLNKDELVAVISKRNEWYRITAPERFKAWVKTSELDQPKTSLANIEQTPEASQQADLPSEPAIQAQIQTPDTQTTEAQATQTALAPIESAGGTITQGQSEDDWLFGQSPEHYTLQLASFDNDAKVQEFSSRAKFANNPNLHSFIANGKDMQWTYFLYGSYPNRSAAEAAKKQIDQKLAWIRTFGRLQQNRCVAWKTQLPTPPELNRYCSQ